MPQQTRAQLTDTVNDLTNQLQAANSAQAGHAAMLTALQEAMAKQADELNEVRARAAEAQAEAAAAAQAQAAAAAEAQAAAAAAAIAQATAAAATAHAQAQADAVPPPPEEPIPKPDEGRFNIQEAMQLSRQDFLTVRATVHNLVKSTQLKWREDFRNQDPTALGQLFKAARKEHPILRRYPNNWATAAIARTYMQNMRKHACKQGYIPTWQGSKNASGSRNRNGRS